MRVAVLWHSAAVQPPITCSTLCDHEVFVPSSRPVGFCTHELGAQPGAVFRNDTSS